ncbi:hypothetical protein U1Q18_033794 [Sarracenia purpurea var. burkii]
MKDLMTKSFTNYVDLKKEATKDLKAGPDSDLEMAATTTKLDRNLGLFLKEAEKGKKEMSSIQEVLGRLHKANKESKSVHRTEALKSLRRRINANVVAVLRKAGAIKSQLEEMDGASAVSRPVSIEVQGRNADQSDEVGGDKRAEEEAERADGGVLMKAFHHFQGLARLGPIYL